MRVREIMCSDVITVPPDMTIVELDQLLMNHGISGAPVLSKDGVPLGMVSKTDVIRALSEEFLQLAGPIREVTVEEIMTRDVCSVAPDTHVADVARVMLERRVHRALVREGDAVAGLVTSFDMLRVLAP